MIRLLAMLALILVLGPTARANADIGTLPGWTVTADDTAVLMTSPPDGNGWNVLYLVQRVERVPGNAEAWFRAETAKVIDGSGTVFGGSGLQYDQDILTEVFHVRRPDTVELYVFFAAYPAAQGYQMMILLYPLVLSEQDPRVSLALDHLAAAWRTKFQLTSVDQLRAAAAPPPAAEEPAAAASGGEAVGAGCRREPVWGFRISPWCQPSGICNDRVIKDYETVCD